MFRTPDPLYRTCEEGLGTRRGIFTAATPKKLSGGVTECVYLCDSEQGELILSATLVAAWAQNQPGRAPRLVDKGGLSRRNGWVSPEEQGRNLERSVTATYSCSSGWAAVFSQLQTCLATNRSCHQLVWLPHPTSGKNSALARIHISISHSRFFRASTRLVSHYWVPPNVSVSVFHRIFKYSEPII